MKSPMMDAIKKRKQGGEQAPQSPEGGDHGHMSHGSQHSEDKSKDLHGFVASLSPEDKHSLKNILAKDSGKNEQHIAKGGPSSEEEGEINEAISEENQENNMDEGFEEHEDGIAKSMLDTRNLNGASANEKPRNLGERVKMNLASKLKAKGKI